MKLFNCIAGVLAGEIRPLRIDAISVSTVARCARAFSNFVRFGVDADATQGEYGGY
jgi:hypothetical protein